MRDRIVTTSLVIAIVSSLTIAAGAWTKMDSHVTRRISEHQTMAFDRSHPDAVRHLASKEDVIALTGQMELIRRDVERIKMEIERWNNTGR